MGAAWSGDRSGRTAETALHAQRDGGADRRSPGGSVPWLVIACVGQYWTHRPQNEHWLAENVQVTAASPIGPSVMAFGAHT